MESEAARAERARRDYNNKKGNEALDDLAKLMKEAHKEGIGGRVVVEVYYNDAGFISEIRPAKFLRRQSNPPHIVRMDDDDFEKNTLDPPGRSA